MTITRLAPRIRPETPPPPAAPASNGQHRAFHLPQPPTDEEKYSYFGVQRRWPFVWLFLSQLCLIYAFTAVMLHSLDTALGLVFLTVMVPPVFVNLWLRMRRRRLTLEDHVVGVESWRASRQEFPSVDVFLPTCGEDPVVLANTFDHVGALEWDGELRVHVLDDADSAATRSLTREYGFEYAVRPNRGEWKKAGNLISAFERTDGEFIAVFDADFAPRPDFLWETVPYMADGTTGVVQTAQYFDVDGRVNYLARFAGALQELFFRWIQPGRDSCEAAICAGTNVVYRRAAVEDAGGFAKVPIGEDVHSGVKLWVAKYHTRYVPIVLAKGLAPDSWNALTNQQYRWCRSSMLLMNSDFFRNAPFGKQQRVSFWAAFLYYMASACLPVTSVLPTLLMVWLFPDTIKPSNYLIMVPSIIATLFVFPLIARGWRPTLYRVATINSFCHLLAVTDALRNRIHNWVPTGAAAAAPSRGSVPQRVTWIARSWLVVTQLLLWAGLARHIESGANPWLVWPAVVLGLVQLWMLAPLFLTLGPAGDVYPERVSSDAEVLDLRRVAVIAPGGRVVTVTTDLGVRRPAPDSTAVPRPKRVERRDIQGLRAIAVALVVLYHANVPVLSGGYVGVDVFFVISGFLITGQIVREIERTGRLSLPSFYARRMRRLLPAAVTVIVVTLVVARLWGPVLQLRQTAIDGVWTSFYAINVHLAAQGVDYQQANGPQSPFQHFWSLAVEEQFYLVWPLLVVATALVARRLRRPALLAVVCAAIGVSLYLSATLTTSAAPVAYFSAQTRAWEFGFGAVVALAATRIALVPRLVRAAATWVGLAMILVSAVVYDADTAFPGVAALVPVAGCALVIAGGCGPLPRRSAGLVLDRGPMQGIGRISYGWYLWHWPLLLLAPAVLGHTYSWVHDVELSLLALWLAFLTYVVIEKPTQRGTLEWRTWLPRGVALSCAGALAAGAVLVTAPTVAGNGEFAAPLDLRTDPTATLAAALATSSTDRSVPGNLTPTLSAASDDVPATESGCHLGFLQVEQGACVYGDPHGTRTVVLFGDSHAQQWNGALDTAAKAAHWKLVSWTKAACPVADVTLVNPTLKRTYTECDEWRQATVERIDALHPSLVVVSQSDSVPGRTVSNDHWAAETLATLQQLRQSGTRIAFLADTPYPKGDVPTCVSDHLADVRACQTSRKQAYHGAALYTERHELVSSTVSGAGLEVVDPVDWLCSPTTCPVIVDDTLVYRDDSHISNTYSRALAPVLAPLLATTPARTK